MMKNPKALDNENLIQETRALVREESRITIEILHFLREIELRKLFCEYACSSLFEFCTRELKYSEASAQRRISAMRLLKEQPGAP